MDRRDIDFDSHGTRCSAWHVSADHDDLRGDRGRPCVVMGHGFGATKDAGLLPFAERFAAAGMDVLLFDYRGYGTSDTDGSRQDVNHLRHREDYVSAVATAKRLDDVDPTRVAVWGSSYAGGHVVAVAAQDPTIAAVVSQGSAMDGLAAVVMIGQSAGIGHLLRLTWSAVKDVARTLTRRAPLMIPVVGPPGSHATITAVGAESGYTHIMGPTFRNTMRARGIIPILWNRPVTAAADLTQPTLFVVARGDNVAPPSAVWRSARLAGARTEVLALDCGHFDIYVGEPFEESVAIQTDFLVRALG